MTVVPWVLVVVLGGVVVWLLLALAGATRTIAALRGTGGDRTDTEAVHHLSSGLPAGERAPTLGPLDDELRGSRRLVVFVDPDCAACDGLVPALTEAAGERRVPLTVFVVRGDPTAHPAAWRTDGDRVRWVIERGDAISEAYAIDVTPTAVVVDEGGMVVASEPTASIDDVLTLVEESDGVRVVLGREVAHGTS